MDETSGSEHISPKLQRVAELAKAMPQGTLTTLGHHMDLGHAGVRSPFPQGARTGQTGGLGGQNGGSGSRAASGPDGNDSQDGQPGMPGVADQPDRVASFQYFSTITLTTVGFGDIVPVTRGDRGPALLGGVIATLVGRVSGARRE